MYPTVDFTRRTFLVHAGRGTIALAVLGVAGCGPALSSAVPSQPAEPPASDGSSASPDATAAGRFGRIVEPAACIGVRRRDLATGEPRVRVGLCPRAGR